MNAFDNIIGYEGVKNELYQVIDIFKEKEKYEKIGAKLPRGVIIFGAPGLGKTMLAEALIKECDVPAFIIKNNKTDRELIKEINDAFTKAAGLDKAIIFLDDLDKYSEIDSEEVDARTFVSIQANIDSVRDKNILVIATVNNISKLPQSLVRNGRFDRKIPLYTPTSEDAAKITSFYLKKKNISKDLDLNDVAKMINYTSCADLETILNESAILAVYDRKEFIDINDIVRAYIKYQYNTTDEDYECSQEEIESTALHEAGHVVISEALKEGSVGFVTIQHAGKNSMHGFTHLCEELRRRPEHVLVALGGKCACEQFYMGRCASGAQLDLSKATHLLYNGIKDSGTCGLGLIDCGNGNSESLNSQTENAVHTELERYMFTCRDILLKNKEFLMMVKKELEEKRYLLYSDIVRIKKQTNLVSFVA